MAAPAKMRKRARVEDRGNGEHKVVVSYSVKELLSNLEEKLDEVLDKLEGKADGVELGKLQAAVEELDRRKAALAMLESIQGRLTELEGKQDVQEAVNKNAADIEKTNKRWRWAVLSLVITTILSIATLIVEFSRH